VGHPLEAGSGLKLFGSFWSWVERHRHIGEPGMSGDQRFAEAVLEREPTHTGEVGLHGDLDLLFVHSTLEPVVGAGHHDPAAFTPPSEFT